ncbi:SLAM family member 5-like [Ctenopharyngodon idella]|uniref:SLAM family member 5-like n=1 Tax=Ctenopharyngodon idella TaxID=7959 RepID=UPI002232295B|nr:SLAM family member 5-like [Ctenopharyngodon idella]
MLQNLTLILLFSLIFIFSSGKFVSSCTYKAEGDNVVIRLGDEKLPQDSHLIWTHDKRRVYSKKGSNVKNEGLTINHYGSLILENIQKSKSGEYKAEVFDKDGKLIKKTVEKICVLEPVPEPSVTVECVEEGVYLTCIPVNSNEVSVSWTKNGEKSNTTRAVLHVSSSELKSGDKFSCTLSNMISEKTAKDVQPVCSNTGVHANEDENRKKEENSNNENKDDDGTEKKLLFGLDFWWMLVILSGGASFLLILFIICLVCVCRCCSRSKRKAKEEAEFRLVSLMPDHANQPDEPYMQSSESQRPSKSQRPLPPLPSPRGPPAVEPQ